MAEPQRYLVLWTTTLTEHHRNTITADDVERDYSMLAAALRAGRIPIDDGTEEMDQLREYAASIEGFETQADVIVEDRVVTIDEEERDYGRATKEIA